MGPSIIWAIHDRFINKILMSRIQNFQKASFSGFEPINIREFLRWIRIRQRFIDISNLKKSLDRKCIFSKLILIFPWCWIYKICLRWTKFEPPYIYIFFFSIKNINREPSWGVLGGLGRAGWCKERATVVPWVTDLQHPLLRIPTSYVAPRALRALRFL